VGFRLPAVLTGGPYRRSLPLVYRRSLPLVYRRVLRRVLRRLPPTFKLLDDALAFVLFLVAFTLLFDLGALTEFVFGALTEFVFGALTEFVFGTFILRVRFCRFTPNVAGAFGVFDVVAPISILYVDFLTAGFAFIPTIIASLLSPSSSSSASIIPMSDLQ
jgi:hypothetical protein